MWHKGTLAVLLLLLIPWGPSVHAEYWIDWEGNDWPDAMGYTRSWGNWEGLHHGFGAYRTLENGILTYDSMYDPGVFDYYYMTRPGQMNPLPGETLVIEWRLKVDAFQGHTYDPAIGWHSDDWWDWGVGFGFRTDAIVSAYESNVTFPIAPGVFHNYRVTSTDLRTYDLYIDGDFIHEGAFCQGPGTQSYAAFGDSVQGGASYHQWDFVRFGAVVPEPMTFGAVAVLLACRGYRRG